MTATHFVTCNLCDALCGLELAVEDGRIASVRGDKDDVLSRGHVCPKGAALGELHDDPDRLRAPVRRVGASWQRTSFDAALDEAARRLRDVRQRHGNDAVALYVGNPTAHSHRTALGAAVLMGALATKHRFDANSQDSNPRLAACMEVYGDPLAVPVPDVDRCDFLLLLGANPAASNGSMWGLGDVRGRLRGVRARGGRLVVVDPRRTETAAWADEHVFVRPGGDAALLLAMLEHLFATGRVDRRSVRQVADGLEVLEALVRRFPAERVAASTGIAADKIRALATRFADARRAVAYGRIGTCQNEFGPVANWLVEALNVVTGNFDREGGAMFPTPAADLGAIARVLVGSGRDRWRSEVRGLPEFLGALPSTVMAEEIEAGHIRALVVVAGNPVLSVPEGDRLSRALDRLDVVVAVDRYVNETSRHAHLVLPPLGALETGNFDLLMLPFAVRNVVKWSPPVLPRPDGALDDWEILSDLAFRVAVTPAPSIARRLRARLRDLPDRIVDSMLRFGPHRLRGRDVRAATHGIDLGPLVPSRASRVRTPDARVRLAPSRMLSDIPRLEAWIDARRPDGLVLIGRRHLRSNNSWMHNLPSLVKGPDRARLRINPGDARARNLSDGMRVRVRSRVGAVEVPVEISDEMMPGVVSLPHGYGHGIASDTMRVAGRTPGVNMNVLVGVDRVEPVAGTSILNGIPVEIEPA